MELWRHKRNNFGPIFHQSCFLSHISFCQWLEWRHHVWFWSKDDQPYLWHRVLTLRRSFEFTSSCRPHTYILVAKLAFLCILRSWGRICDYFFRYFYTWPNIWLIDLLTRTRYRFRCQSGPWPSLTSGNGYQFVYFYGCSGTHNGPNGHPQWVLGTHTDFKAPTTILPLGHPQ